MNEQGRPGGRGSGGRRRCASQLPGSGGAALPLLHLLTPTGDQMCTELVYRAHCAELPDRVAAGEDTRPGTAGEVCVACCQASLFAPLTTSATGLYVRMWGQAFPGHLMFGDGEQSEALRGTLIDDVKRDARRKLARAGRLLSEIDCSGRHHGEPAGCAYQRAGSTRA